MWLSQLSDPPPEEGDRSYDGRIVFLPPRAVERQYPDLTREVLAKRRNLGLAPWPETVSGCLLYPEPEIERFLAVQADARREGAPKRYATYVRSETLQDPSTGDHSKACEEFLRKTDWWFVTTVIDFGPPNTRERMLGGFRNLLGQASLGEFDILLVSNMDQIATNAASLRSFRQELACSGVSVWEAESGALPVKQTVPAASKEVAHV